MITDIQTTPPFPKAGENIKITVSLMNEGGEGRVKAKIWVDNEVVYNIDYNLPSLGVWKPTVQYTMPNNIIKITVEEFKWSTHISRWVNMGGSSTTRNPSVTPPCTPSWVCEPPFFNGYEVDGCGNRRSNPRCSASLPGVPPPVVQPPVVQLPVEKTEENPYKIIIAAVIIVIVLIILGSKAGE